MKLASNTTLFVSLVLLAACGSRQDSTDTSPKARASEEAPTASDEPTPLGIGARYQSWNKVTTKPHLSPTHGKRFVEIYVNDIGFEAYKSDEAEMPVGSVVVKESFAAKDGAPSSERGPLFVMEKRAPGYNEEGDNWYYALHWADIPESWVSRMGGKNAYWQSPEKKTNYCLACHENYDRSLGMPKVGYRSWEEAAEPAE